MPYPSRRKTLTKPKLFQCTGYGDCGMVFTRSEHLARHARKHTGEKPFRCIVSGCEKRFSRFDNMMQHTQTHRRPSFATREGHDTERAAAGLCSPPLACMSEVTLCENFEQSTRSKPPPQPLCLDNTSGQYSMEGGLLSPVSVTEEKDTMPAKRRRLSVAELCNPPMEKVALTRDEYEALQGLSRFRHTPNAAAFDNTLRDIAWIHSPRPSPSVCTCL